MNPKKWGLIAVVFCLLLAYNGMQPSLLLMRTMDVPGYNDLSSERQRELGQERYGPSMAWLDRLRNAQTDRGKFRVALDFRVLSSVMVAGLASGFKSQVANLLWMKSDEYWHKGLLTRQIPLMEAVVTLDPQFIDAWSTAGWHWAYNIYADIDLDPKNTGKPQYIRQEQEKAVETGLDYLRRGAEMNPETFRLWFEYGWTREHKAGLIDETTADLYRMARDQKDAREIEQVQPDGTSKKVNGLDVVGHTIGHLYEDLPDIEKALDLYGLDLLKATPQELEQLRQAGAYWRQYGSDYDVIYTLYQDPVYHERLKQLVPDVEQLVQAHETRLRLSQGQGSQPTGAYVTLSARYLPAWELMEEGDALAKAGQQDAAQAKYGQARELLIGVMNADSRFHLQGLPVTARVLALKGDSEAAVKARLEQLRAAERDAAQNIGLHFLALLYEKSAAGEPESARRQELLQKAYETWYRARVRNSLDFYALRKTREYEDKYSFKTPQAIVDQAKESRMKGTVNVAPPPPNVSQYQ